MDDCDSADPCRQSRTTEVTFATGECCRESWSFAVTLGDRLGVPFTGAHIQVEQGVDRAGRPESRRDHALAAIGKTQLRSAPGL